MKICDKAKDTLDKVTKKICPIPNSDICEVYVKKGDIDGIYIDNCKKYCDKYGLRCLAGYEDKDGCEKNRPDAIECDVEFTGSSVKDLICRCGNLIQYFNSRCYLHNC